MRLFDLDIPLLYASRSWIDQSYKNLMEREHFGAYRPLYTGFFGCTLLPGGSEAALVALMHQDTHPVWLLLAVASLGNILGSVVNYALGRFALRYRDRRWFPVGEDSLAKAQGWFSRWGQWSLSLGMGPDHW